MLSRKPLGYFATEFKYELEILRGSGGKVKSSRGEPAWKSLVKTNSERWSSSLNAKKGGVSSRLTPRVATNVATLGRQTIGSPRFR
jgi:hypothetical protein